LNIEHRLFYYIEDYLTQTKLMFLESASNFDAVIFHIRSMEVNGVINSPEDRWPEKWQNPLERKPSQRYIMLLDESPNNNWFPFESFGNFFNW
jgi:hypothetical protein